MNENKWIEFDTVLIRIKDIDHFKFSDKSIVCTYHVGQSYEEMVEIFSDELLFSIRCNEIKDLLS